MRRLFRRRPEPPPAVSEFPDNWAEIAWDKLPVELRQRAVSRLREVLPEEFFEDVHRHAVEKGLREWMPDFWHHGQGMGIRNLLRSDHGLDPKPSADPIRDYELPPLPELYGPDVTEGNWDDFYVQCLEAAAGLRVGWDVP